MLMRARGVVPMLLVCALLLHLPAIAADATATFPGSAVLGSSPGVNASPIRSSAARDAASTDVFKRAPEFLKVDDAFVFSSRLDGDTLIAHWQMPDGYYLYRARMKFLSGSGNSLRVGAVVLPNGVHHKDEIFGDMEVYYHEVEARVPFVRASGEPVLKVSYQGCADAGLCYPPQNRLINLSQSASNSSRGAASTSASASPPAPTSSSGKAALAPSSAPAAPQSEENRLAGLLADGSVFTALALFFLAGIGLAFTPCVLPMVPILSSIIVGQGGADQGGHSGTRDSSAAPRSRAFSLSLAYVLGMALTYAALGTLVGLFGARLNLQAAFQAPPVLIFSAAVFVALALAMFGLYELQLPSSWLQKIDALNQRQRGGRLWGVAVMGALSALVVSPCVSAPLVGALIYLSSTGDAVLGGAALLALGLGMGLPLLIVGVGGAQLLPRAGAWMENVKAVFGVLLLGVAIWLLERIVPAPVALLLWGALCVGCGVYLGGLEVFRERTGIAKAAQALGVLLLVWGVVLTVGAARGASDPLAPLTDAPHRTTAAGTTAVTPTSALDFTTIHGETALLAELAAASQAHQPVLLDFYADWCISCKLLERNILPLPRIGAALTKFRLLRADVTDNTAQERRLLERFGLFGPPSILLFDRTGHERRDFRIQGEPSADDLGARLEGFLRQF